MEAREAPLVSSRVWEQIEHIVNNGAHLTAAGSYASQDACARRVYFPGWISPEDGEAFLVPRIFASLQPAAGEMRRRTVWQEGKIALCVLLQSE